MKIKKILSRISLAVVLLNGFSAAAQLSGIKYIPGDYSTITAAVAAINVSGPGTGGVTFNIAANYTETISAPISLSATGTSSNPILFQKDPATTGANPLITAYTGGLGTPATSVQDGIWRLSGSDYVTINGIDVKDNPLNTTNPSTMEYGYALYKASASNGCRNVTIQNCTISLNRINNAAQTNPMTEGSAGIIVMNAGAITAIQVIGTVAGGTNSNNKFYSNTIQNCNYGICIIGNADVSPFTLADFNNDIGGSSAATGNTIINFGGAVGATNPSSGIRTINQYGLNVSYNTINNNTGAGVNHPTILRGIFTTSAPGASTAITHNTVTLHGGGTTEPLCAIENAAGSVAAANTINISYNSIVNGSYTSATSANFYGIYNTAAPAILTINGNTVAGNSLASTAGIYAPILNMGIVTTAINIDSNNIGNSVTGAVTYNGAIASNQTFINNSRGAATAALSIRNNNFQGIVYSIQSTAVSTLIFNSAATLSQSITNNTFTNLALNSTGNVFFISNNVIVPSTGTQNVNNNSIVGSFNKTGTGGKVTLFTNTAICAFGSLTNNNNNNFSNITVAGSTFIDGWVSIDTGYSAKIIQNNTFSNWIAGTGNVNAMNVNHTSTNAVVTGNVINNISGGGTVTGITTAFGNDKIFSNTIYALSSIGASNVTGILITGGTNKNIYGNKIYGLQLNNTGGMVSGISVTGSTLATANIYNNLIGDLRAPIANSGSDVVRGISVTTISPNSTINLYFNTIYLNASSTGASFSSSGVYHISNATATTAALYLRNNIITNFSTPNGSGLAVAYRRSSITSTNYASTSNNNLFYAGTPASNKLLFYDGSSSVQLLAAYKTLIAPRDAQSVTEDLVTTSKFLSTSGASASFLHIDSVKSTQVESGAVNIPNFTRDADNQVRQGNAGYAGAATAPDIGADEISGMQATGLSGTYNVGAGQVFTSLTNAGGLFANINNLGLSGNVTVYITSDLTEDGSNILNSWIEQGSGNYTLAILPDASITRTIAGDVLAGMIRFNGAKRITIDGSNGTTNNYLTFRNTNTAGSSGSAFILIGGASANTIKYCNIEAYTNATNGVILFSNSTAVGGNSNNLVTNCNISATVGGNTGSLCIYSVGSIGNENSSNTISNNNIFNYKDKGIDIAATGSKNWVIGSNSFYNGSITASINYPATSILFGIRVLGGGGYSIVNNYIGGSTALASGSNAAYSSTLGNLAFYGIQVTAGTGTNNIKGNTIKAITVSSVPTLTNANEFIGIEAIGAGIINVGGTSAGDGNTIGSNTINGSIIINTNTTAPTNTSFIRGINYSGTNAAGVVIGNKIGGFDINNIGNSVANAASSTFQGIIINTATAPAQVNGNLIGSAGPGAALNSIRVMSGSTANSTTLTGLYLSSTVASTVQVNANVVQNLSQQVTSVTSGTFTGIYIGAIAGANISVTNNSIKFNSVASTTAAFYGIQQNGNPTSVIISGDTISNNTSTAGTTGLMYGVHTTGTAPSNVITNNTFSENSTAALTNGAFTGIFNSGNAVALSINNNSFYGNQTTSGGPCYAIYNSGAITATININGNNVGNSTSAAITYNAANATSQYFINNAGGAGTATLSISNNNIQGTIYSVPATCTNFFINNSAPVLSRSINGNTFTNLNVNTSGSAVFISDNVALPANGIQNINNNSIAGTFTKSTGNTVTLFSTNSSSGTGSVVNHNNNNFSNISVSGATTIAGWVFGDTGPSAKTIQNNTFSNWSGGSNAVTAMSLNFTGANNAITGNLINNISGQALVTGISSGGNDNIYSNTINTLSTTGANTAVTGISLTGGTTKNIYKNKIYDLQSATGNNSIVNGILVSGSTIVGANIYNNLVGDLRTPNANFTTDVIRGISITSTTVNSSINVYFNSVYINASSTGTNFSTSGIYHTVNNTATTASLNLRNNSITNTSTPKGTGTTVAYRRSGTSLNNYPTTSNNNLFYGGIPAAKKLIFYDGTNSDSTIALYKTRVSTRDASSVTESLATKFLSTTGSSSLFLHMDTTQYSLVHDGGVNITGFKDDFDGQIRAGNAGYVGIGTKPDIGADETFGLEIVPPSITYTVLNNTISTLNRNVTGITITDASGINNISGTNPRIYYKRFSDANTWLDNTSITNGWKYTEATNSTSPYAFTIDYSLLYGGAAVTAGIIQYFIVAQDNATTANIGINSGSFSIAPASVALTSAAFPMGGTINSYNIAFTGSYNVGATEVFTSLTKSNGLFAAINTAGLVGNVTLNLTSDLAEDGSNALNQWTETGAGNYTLTIQSDVATGRTISGNAAGGLIRLNGADRVVIDGRNGGSGSYLSFINTNTAGTTGTAFTFINGATNNIIRYCDIEAYSNATNGVMLFGSSNIAGGNSNNLIDNCTINATVASLTGNTAIYSAGTVTKENSSNTISNNNIYNYRDRGLDIAAIGSSTWSISGNSFFNGDVTAPINFAAASSLHGIRILGGSGYAVLNNYIGGNAMQASGANAVYASTSGNISFYGILLTTTSASPVSNIKGNTIAAIALSVVPTSANTTVFTGIETNGFGINIGGSSGNDGNTIGSNLINGSVAIVTATSSASNTSLITGINCLSSSGIVNYNNVGGFDVTNIGAAPAPSSMLGINVNNAAAPTQVNNNLIGSSTTANSIRITAATTAAATFLTAISIGTSVNSVTQVNNNRIDNISNLSTVSSGSFTGINNGANLSGAVITINSDTVQNISTAVNSSAASAVYAGIVSGTAATISNNIINTISLASTGVNAQLQGISVSGAYANTISGNTLFNFSTASNKVTAVVETGTPAGASIIGILNAATAAGQNIYNNILSNFTATSIAAVNTVVAGIGITASVSGSVYNNRLNGFSNVATGAGPGLCGLIAAGGSFNVYNNVIKISNAFNTNGMKIYGIAQNAGSNWNYFHNTIEVSGSGSGSALRSAAFIRAINAGLILKDNVFINKRTGSGASFSVSNLTSPAASNWSASASDYNDLYSSNSNTVAEWGLGINQTFTQWQTATGGDAHSVTNSVSFIFSVIDLQPDSLANCALNNSGTPITSPILINTDISTNGRNAVSPDMGAYEFNYNAFSATAGNASPVCTGTSIQFTADAGTALSPTYSWTNPGNAVVSTLQNPDMVALPGIFIVKVTDANGCTDTASTLVTTYIKPTAALTGPSFICSGSNATLTVTVTGSSTINGTLNTGESFGPIGPSALPINVTPVSGTVYFIASLYDDGCTSVSTDYPDTVNVKVSQDGEWIGVNSTSWNDAGNWCGGIPSGISDVIIAAGAINYPVIGVSASVHDLSISSGASLVNNNMLQIGGTIVNTGTFNVSAGTVEMNGALAQTIAAGSFANNTILNLIIGNDVTLSGQQNITGTLSFSASNKTFTTNGYLAMKSTATGTAGLADITNGGINNGNLVTGNVTTERYLPAKRAWRLLTIPITGQTIRQAWCGAAIAANPDATAGNDPAPHGYGTLITGHGYASGTLAAANGFDWFTGLGANTTSSIRYYNTSNIWASASNTPLTTVASDFKQGYMLYVRGDRTIASSTGTLSTTLRPIGVLKQGTQTIPVNETYSLVGNPYAAQINLDLMYNNSGNSSVIKRNFWVWDATYGTSGSYRTLSWSGIGSVYNMTGAGGTGVAADYLVANSGQAFFVEMNSPGSIQIKETNKTSVAAPAVFRPTGEQGVSNLSIKLYQATGSKLDLQADGVLARYNGIYKVAPDENFDAPKLNNFNENISLVRQGRYLSIESRPYPTNNDTLFIPFWGLSKRDYALTVTSSQLDHLNQTARLMDAFTNTSKQIDLENTTITFLFTITNDPASSSLNRFTIVMEPLMVLPVNFTTVMAKIYGVKTMVNWSTASEIGIKSYDVERSEDGVLFTRLNNIIANQTSISGMYQVIDEQPFKGNNFYRIRGNEEFGKSIYSSIVKVNFDQMHDDKEMKVYGTVMIGNTVNLQLKNIEKGIYTINLYNMSGQLLKQLVIKHDGSNAAHTFTVDKYLPSGNYKLQLSGNSFTITTAIIK